MESDSDVDISWVELAEAKDITVEELPDGNRVPEDASGGGGVHEIGEGRLEKANMLTFEPGALLKDVERVLAAMTGDRMRVEQLFGRERLRVETGNSQSNCGVKMRNDEDVKALMVDIGKEEGPQRYENAATAENVVERVNGRHHEAQELQGLEQYRDVVDMVERMEGGENEFRVCWELKGGKEISYEPGASYLCDMPWNAAQGRDDHHTCICVECEVKCGRRSGMTGNTGRLRLRKEDKRPFAEPPHFDYELFQKEHVPSDKMIIEMFPNDPQRRTKYRDVHTENELLTMFHEWSSKTHKEETRACSLEQCAVCRFHERLVADLEIDFHDVGEEYKFIQTSLSDLQTWQKTHLDMDGELEIAQQRLDAGIDIFGGRGGFEALRKYGPYFERIPKDDLQVWERNHLADNGTIPLADKDLSKDLFYLFEPPYLGRDEAREKYCDLFVALREMQMTPGDFVRGMRRGEDKFATLDDTEIEAARSLFRSVIAELPPYPKHDLATWEWFHFGESIQEADKFMARVDLNETHFQGHFYGGVEARSKWGYLVWENTVFQEVQKFSDTPTQRQLCSGIDIFWPGFDYYQDYGCNTAPPQWAEDSARFRWQQLLDEMDDPPKHDLATWERFHLHSHMYGKETVVLETESAHLEVYHYGELVFEPRYFGGVEVRAKWGWVLWEHNVYDCIPYDGPVKIDLEAGVDIFGPGFVRNKESEHLIIPQWAEESARSRYQHLLEETEKPSRHDLETWERYQLDEDGKGTVKLQNKLIYDRNGEKIFGAHCFGGVEARAKWGWVLWECNVYARNNGSFKEDHETGVDIFGSGFVRNKGGEYFPTPQWAEESARSRYEHLLDKSRHDLKTWEKFQLDADGQGTTNARKKLAVTNNLFSAYYFGGVQARKKWGYLRWEVDWLEDDGSTAILERELGYGRDPFAPGSWRLISYRSCYSGEGEDYDPWVIKSARDKYGYLYHISEKHLQATPRKMGVVSLS